MKKIPVEKNFSQTKRNSAANGKGDLCWSKSRSAQVHTRSSGESACSPPTWTKLPSLANCRCRCSGMADLAILLGMWEPARNSLLRSNSLMCSATASFLCRRKRVWCSEGGGSSRLTSYSHRQGTESHQFFVQVNSTDLKVKHEEFCHTSGESQQRSSHQWRNAWEKGVEMSKTQWNDLVSGSSWATTSGSLSSLFRLWHSSTLVFSLIQICFRCKKGWSHVLQQVTHTVWFASCINYFSTTVPISTQVFSAALRNSGSGCATFTKSAWKGSNSLHTVSRIILISWAFYKTFTDPFTLAFKQGKVNHYIWPS